MTARQVYHAARRTGIVLSVKTGSIACKGAPSAIAPIRADVARVKLELMAMLEGNYIAAAYELLDRETQPGAVRDDLAQRFDERASIASGSYGIACRMAYIEIAHAVEVMTRNVEARAA